jgi:hypothetical protein
MKFFATLLSFYVLFLTALPCIDKPDNNFVQKTVISAQHTGNHLQEVDHCSPFCTCNCCSSPKIQQDLVIDFFCKVVMLHYFADPSLQINSMPLAPIWQPPQLA